MPIPLDSRRRPASVKIHVTSGAGVDITWADGHASHFEFEYLREWCPCASCDDERRKKQNATVPASPTPGTLPGMGAALPMFKPKPRAVAALPVGNYAIQITFNDGHATGIYSFDYLRHICPCNACAREFRSET
jgi:DUF971 family protein